MSENWRQSEIYIMINDKPQGSIVKHFSCDGLLHYKFITFLLVKEVVKSVNIRRSYTFGTLHFCHQRCKTHQASINTFLFSNFCTEDSRIIIDLTYRPIEQLRKNYCNTHNRNIEISLNLIKLTTLAIKSNQILFAQNTSHLNAASGKSS